VFPILLLLLPVGVPYVQTRLQNPKNLMPQGVFHQISDVKDHNFSQSVPLEKVFKSHEFELYSHCHLHQLSLIVPSREMHYLFVDNVLDTLPVLVLHSYDLVYLLLAVTILPLSLLLDHTLNINTHLPFIVL